MYPSSTMTQKVLSTLQTHPRSSALKRELYEFCERIIYTYPVQIRLLAQEEASELLLSVYPRIGKLLATFTDQGIPFEIYMKKISYLPGCQLSESQEKGEKKIRLRNPHRGGYRVLRPHVETDKFHRQQGEAPLGQGKPRLHRTQKKDIKIRTVSQNGSFSSFFCAVNCSAHPISSSCRLPRNWMSSSLPGWSEDCIELSQRRIEISNRKKRNQGLPLCRETVP